MTLRKWMRAVTGWIAVKSTVENKKRWMGAKKPKKKIDDENIFIVAQPYVQWCHRFCYLNNCFVIKICRKHHDVADKKLHRNVTNWKTFYIERAFDSCKRNQYKEESVSVDEWQFGEHMILLHLYRNEKWKTIELKYAQCQFLPSVANASHNHYSIFSSTITIDWISEHFQMHEYAPTITFCCA